MDKFIVKTTRGQMTVYAETAIEARRYFELVHLEAGESILSVRPA